VYYSTTLGRYEYQRLLMGLCKPRCDLEFVRTYIDDLIILTKDSWENHLSHVRTLFSRFKDAGLKIHTKTSFFGRSELEYLGYWITRDGVQPLLKKVQAILNIKSPANKKQLRSLLRWLTITPEICGYADQRFKPPLQL